MNATPMGVLAAMPSTPTPLSMAAMTGASGVAAALMQTPKQPAAVTPRENRALVFSPASLSDASLVDGLSGNSRAQQFMLAAANNNVLSLTLFLPQHDILPDFTNRNGFSPLMAAAALGAAQTLEMLASHPLVRLARADEEGWTALHYAAYLNQREAVAILLKHHAPADAVTTKGLIAFDLGDEETQKVFLQNSAFKRFLKLRNPEHPLLSPAPPVAEAVDAQEPEIQRPVLTETFYDALKDIGLAIQKGSTVTAHEQLNAKLAKMDTYNLNKAYRSIAQTGVKYDWDDVFIRAAGAGNTAAMVFLQDEIFFEQRVLNRALWQAAVTGQRNAAHHLMLWEADPLFSQKLANGVPSTAIDLAWQRRHTGVIEEMALWSDVKKTAPAIERYLHEVRGSMTRVVSGTRAPKRKTDDDLFMPLISLSAMLTRREELARGGISQLTSAFARVTGSGNITEILATYAESQRPRFLRGKTTLDAKSGAAAMGWALVHERVEFARKLAADGYKFAQMPESLQQKALQSKSEAARDLARELLINTTYYPRIEETGKRSTSPSAIRQLRTGLMID
ncbi:MAG: ankyrin repeat domain-containing protein [bacterium]|nr:ankyrin repeat domain-containing protein [bacterium]